MTSFRSASLAVAVLALSAAPVFADSFYDGVPLAPFGAYPRPAASVADVTNPGFVYAQPDGAGVYDCQLDEKRTRLQRRACGPLKNRFGY